jgi:hypothetical protein
MYRSKRWSSTRHERIASNQVEGTCVGTGMAFDPNAFEEQKIRDQRQFRSAFTTEGLKETAKTNSLSDHLKQTQLPSNSGAMQIHLLWEIRKRLSANREIKGSGEDNDDEDKNSNPACAHFGAARVDIRSCKPTYRQGCEQVATRTSCSDD